MIEIDILEKLQKYGCQGKECVFLDWLEGGSQGSDWRLFLKGCALHC